MIRTWIDPIYDRTYEDIQSVQYDPNQENPKGCWNDVDLNRVEQNTAYCAEWMYEKKIVRTPPSITVRENNYWQKNMIPTKAEIDRICNNVRLLVELSRNNPAIADQLPTIYAATQPNYVLANQIEYALYLMHDQPRLPLEYFRVTLEHGIIVSIVRDSGETELIGTNTALVAEDEVVTIQGAEYGEYAQYQTFTYWSGEPADIGLLDDYRSRQTFFEMPYGREINFTANFETHIPRTLTINNGYISPNKDPHAETGPSTGTYYAGDEIMIIANVASNGKAFYEWTGTAEALEHITGVTEAEDPSTCVLTMPDCDVTLTPHYINAGQHSVTVNYGSGGGWYNYKDYVSIYANIPDHYAFSHWSGATSYLTDIYGSSQSFQMGDVNISFTANFTYVYSYNDVQVINGLIRINGSDVTRARQLRQESSQTLVPTPPNSNQGIDYWSIEGEGRIATDYLGNQTNTFIVGDGNAIITGHYAPLKTLSIVNGDNASGTSTMRIVPGRKTRITTTEIVGDYIFSSWTEGGNVLSTGYRDNAIMRFDYTMPSRDVTITTNYRLRNQVDVVIDYGNHVETVTMTERSSRSITADPAPTGKHFSRWNYSGIYNLTGVWSTNASFTAGSGNGTITAVYEYDQTYHTLTVNAGSGSGTYAEGSEITIDGNQAAYGYEFDHWVINSGNGTIDNIYSKQTKYRMGTNNGEITATYKLIPTFTVTMVDGYIWDGSDWVSSAVLPRDSTNNVKMKPAPTGKQFLQWEVYINGVLQTDANDVLEPLAEQTALRGLSRTITLKATYYIPDPTLKYTLTITRKDGSTDQNDYPAGTDISIYASYPDQGYEFWRWTGDTAYIVGGVTNPQPYIHMPAQNIGVTETYQPEGYIPEYKVDMTNIYGQCCYETSYEDPETHEIITTEHWVSTYEHYKQEDVVKIRATGFDNEYYFDQWTAYNHDTEEDARSVITNLNAQQTTLIMPDYDLDVEPVIPLKQLYSFTVIDGGDSGMYYEGKRIDVYFNKVNTNDVHYDFIRWVDGTNTQVRVYQLELYDGGMFNPTNPGDSQHPQQVKMPAKRVEIKATYDTKYRVTLTGGTINETGLTEGFYTSNSQVAITADTPQTGMRFQYWDGDASRLASKYDPTTIITTTAGVTNLRAVYSTDADRNDIGYATTSLKSTTTINNNDITIISGTIEVGFIITDSLGHIYVITAVDTEHNTSTIYRMTKVVEGGNIYG